ncbi:MAG TPA: helix-turn-helix transcriptional regulator [Candidatus Faecisoma merdavium]|nr:helix-turn-helix transcriptional regulator [Candidatus Faecisoma merdavium]
MNKLQQYRKRYNYSCQDMADILNISKSFYWQIENNKRRLNYDTALKIAKIFKMKPDNLFYDDYLKKQD